ncbi:Protein GST-30 [Aphelenchoides avenae]|nr:Protein GST-30 [Aphelenchus avenae]
MVQYKLVYFPVRNLGEAIRMVLAYAEQKYEDVRIPFEDWPKLKQKMPHGHMPVLYVDGEELAQSQTIARYLARKYGLAGRGEWEQAKVDEILDFQKDLHKECLSYIFTSLGFQKGDLDTLRSACLEALHKSLPVYDRQLRKSTSGFFMSSGFTVADFWVADFLYTIKGIEPSVLESYPELDRFISRVYSIPRIQEYIAKRPKTPL